MATTLRLLLIEDREEDALLLVRELRRGGYDPAWERVDTLAALTDAIERQAWDVITCDWVMPQFSAPAALALLRERDVDTPIIIVSGEVGEEIAVTAMREGAHDAVSKQRLTRLVPAIARELQDVEVRRAKRQAEEALRAAHARLDLALTASHAGVWDWDLTTDTTEYSQHWQDLLGYTGEEIGTAVDWLTIVHPDDRARLLDYVREYASHPSSPYEVEFRVRDKQGTDRWFLSRATGVLDSAGTLLRLRGMHIDITERRRIEVALRDSEARYRLLAENASDLLARADQHGVLLDVSLACRRVLGYEPHELIGQSVFDYIHPDDLLLVAERYREMFDRPAAVPNVCRVRRKDGIYIWMEGTARLVVDGAASSADVVLVARDITERTRAEEKFRALLEAAPNAMVIVDQDGQIRLINAQTEALFGYTRGELLGQSVEILMPARFHRQHEGHRARYVAVPSVRPMGAGLDLYGRRKDGTEFPVEISLSPLATDEGLLVTSAIRDVTERRRAEAAIHQLTVELDQRVQARTAQLAVANQELEAFSYSVSHDLRAPLRTISGFSGLLLETCGTTLDAESVGMLDRIRAATQHMEHLIQGLLDLARVAREEMTWQAVKLSDLAHAIAADLQKDDPSRRVEFVITPGLVVQGDARLVRSALQNLLGNAWKYTSKHGTARIEFGTLEGERPAVYFVRDDGAGFEMACVEKLFGAFQRLHSRAEFEGTGIGLATVQRIIRRHGGRIWADAAPERGATFFFTLVAPDS